MNKSDSERIGACFDELGFLWKSDKYRADYVVLVTCGIRQSAENKVYGLVQKIKKENKNSKIILTGCLENRADVRKKIFHQVDFWLPIVDLYKLPAILGFSDFILEKDYLKNKAKINSSFSAFVPIGNGCDNFCSYCVVPYARGREKYRAYQDILAEVECLVKKGYKEITLIAQNVNSYFSPDKEKNIHFADLLKMVDELSGDFWLRFTTSHPKDMSDELILTMANCKKLCHHLHLPAQSGSNKILQKMNRKYTIEHYKNLIDKVRKNIPDIAITTDIIVGFPGEGEEDFVDTEKLFEVVAYDMAYIAQYSPRPGTASFEMNDDVLDLKKKQREKRLMDILRKKALLNNQKYLGKVLEVLIEGKDRKGFWCGKNKYFKNVRCLVSGNEDFVAKIVRVRIEKVSNFGMEGVIV